MSNSSGLRIALGGAAVVYCVHDRVKRAVTSDAQLVALLAHEGEIFDGRQHRIHRCACCDNLFSDSSDVPRLCTICMGGHVHVLNGNLATPIGEVDG